MAKNNTTAGLNITRQQMIGLLNEDLAGEYQAIIAYTVYSQMLKGAAYTDIAWELEVHAGEELQHAIKIASAATGACSQKTATTPSVNAIPANKARAVIPMINSTAAKKCSRSS